MAGVGSSADSLHAMAAADNECRRERMFSLLTMVFPGSIVGIINAFLTSMCALCDEETGVLLRVDG